MQYNNKTTQEQSKKIRLRAKEKDIGMMVGNTITNSVNILIAGKKKISKENILKYAMIICEASLEFKEYYKDEEVIEDKEVL